MNPYDVIRKWEADPEFQRLPREKQAKAYSSYFDKAIAAPEWSDDERNRQRAHFLAGRKPPGPGRAGRGSAEAARWESTYKQWNNDPEFQTLPPETKKKAYSRYFDKEIIGKRAQSISGTEKEHLRSQFLRSLDREPEYNRTPVAVDRVLDGDTVKLQDGRTIRFSGVDTPEKKQEHGQQSKSALQEALAAGKNVSIHTTQTDPYGREIAYVYVDGKLANQAMVESGEAWVYDHFARNADDYDEWKAVERAAKEARKGLWSGNPVPPWEWRRDGGKQWLAEESHRRQQAQQVDNAQPMTPVDGPAESHSIADMNPMDPVRELAAGAGEFMGSLAWAMNKIMPMDMEVDGRKIPTTSQALQRSLENFAKGHIEKQSPAWKASQAKTYTGEGEAWTDPSKLAGTLLRSAPGMIAGMGTGAGITTSLIRRGMSSGIAGIIGGAIGEGSAAAIPNAHQTHKMVMNAPAEIITGTPEYQEAFAKAEGTVQEKDMAARTAAADRAALAVGVLSGTAVGITGAPSGAALGKLLGGQLKKGFARNVGRQMGLEGLQEGVQSPLEVGMQNLAAQRYVDPDRKFTEGMGEAAIEGSLAGMAMGGGMGAVGLAISPVSSETAQPGDANQQGDRPEPMPADHDDAPAAQPNELPPEPVAPPEAEIRDEAPVEPVPEPSPQPTAEPQPSPAPPAIDLAPDIRSEVNRTIAEIGPEAAAELYLADDPVSQYAKSLLAGEIQPEPQTEGGRPDSPRFDDTGLSPQQRAYVLRRVSDIGDSTKIAKAFPDPADPVDAYARQVGGIDKPSAQGPEMVEPETRAAKREGRSTFPIQESPEAKQDRESAGLTEIMTVDAQQLQDVFEREEGEPLEHKPHRSQNIESLINDRVSIDSYPRVGAQYRFGIDDGRHRVAVAARRGDTIQIATTPESRQVLEQEYGFSQTEGEPDATPPPSPGPPAYSIGRREIESAFKGQKVIENKDGTFEVDLPSGKLSIQAVERIDIDSAAFEIAYNRKATAAELSYGASGSYHNGVIKISRRGDKFTLDHESYHHLERLGHITPSEVRAINAEIGKADASFEDRANWIEQNLYKRDQYRQKGMVYKAMQKIGDIIDMGKNLMKRSGRSVLRGMESGRIQGRQANQEYAIDPEGEGYSIMDPELVNQLESDEKVKLYRAMQLIDGKLYPPMSAEVDGEMREPTPIGQWERSVEQPELADDNGMFKLKKGRKDNTSDNTARYNPYFHASWSPLNDQFSSAYRRPNLITVEIEIPKSELTSGYHAEKAKDSVGEKQWNAGPVSSKLPKGRKRTVTLSRFSKVLRIVPDSEVAAKIKDVLEGVDAEIPNKVLTPSLKAELEKLGVSIGKPSAKELDRLRKDAKKAAKAEEKKRKAAEKKASKPKAKKPKAKKKTSKPAYSVFNAEFREAQAAERAINPDRRGYVFIHKLRNKLGWDRDKFNKVFAAMVDEGIVAAHPGNPAALSKQQLQDSWSDNFGDRYYSFSWRKDPDAAVQDSKPNEKPQRLPEGPRKSQPDNMADRMAELRAASDKLFGKTKNVSIPDLRRELGWDYDAFNKTIGRLASTGYVKINKANPADMLADDVIDAWHSGSGDVHNTMTWYRKPKSQTKPKPKAKRLPPAKAVSSAVEKLGGLYVPIHKLRAELGLDRQSFDKALMEAAENQDIFLQGGDPSTMTMEEIENSFSREKAGRRRDYFSVSLTSHLRGKTSSSEAYSVLDRTLDKDYTPEPLKDIFGRKQVTVRDVLTEKLDLGKDPITQGLDRLNPIKQHADLKSYKINRLFSDETSTVQAAFEHGGIRWEGNAPIVEKAERAFVPWMEKLGDDAKNFLYWLAAKRAEVLEGQGRENWLDETNRQKIYDYVGDAPRHNDYDTWDQINDEFQQMNRQILDFAQEAGLFTAEDRSKWEQYFYLPFYRLYDDQVNPKERLLHPQGGNQHLANVIKRLTGEKAKLGDPLENILANWSTLIGEAMRNKGRLMASDASNRLGKLSRIKGPDGKPLPIIQEVSAQEVAFNKSRDGQWIASFRGESNVVSFLRDGKRVFARVNDLELFNALTTADAMRMENLVMKLFTKSKRLLTSAATFSGVFIVNNMVRDTLHLAITTKSFIPFLDTAIGFAKAWRNDADTIAYRSAGGGMAGSYTRANDPEAMARYLQSIYGKKGIIEKVIPWAKIGWDYWAKLQETSEIAARVRAYQKMRQRGMSHEDAAFEAKDLLDFTMRGQAKTVQYFIQTVPFLNARIQGLYKLGRSARENPYSFSVKGSMMMAASLALWGMNRDEEWYQELEDWDKHQYYHFMVGDKRIRLPKPFEVGAIFSTLVTASASVMAGDEEMDFLMEALKTTAIDTLALNPIPQVAKPAMEVYFNKSTFTDRSIVGMRHQGLPAHLQADPWDSETLRSLAKQFGFSPKQANHLLNGYFSTYATCLLGLSDIFFHHAGDFDQAPEKRIEDYPLVGKIIRELPNRNVKYVTRFYEFFDELDKNVRAVNFYRQTGDLEKARAAANKNPKLWRNQKNINKVKFDIGAINRQIRMVYYSNRSPEWKRKKIDDLTSARNKLSKIMYDRLVE